MKGLLWVIWFAAILCISTIYLFASHEWSIGILGFPNWLLGFFLIEMLLVGSIGLFTIKYWKSPKERS